VNRWTSALALLLCACGSSEPPPPPAIVAVTPRSVSRSECFLLAVELNGVLPVKLNYGEDSVKVASLTEVGLADRSLPVLRLEDQGRRLVTEAYSGLPVGSHPVSVKLQDGQLLHAPEGLEVTPKLVLDSFQIDPIVNQVRDSTFKITLRAMGRDAHLFHGRVQLRSTRGLLAPAWSEPFQNGVIEQEVTIDAPGGNTLIELTDCEGRMVTSNEFRLEPKP
jgi:hypothetical protein